MAHGIITRPTQDVDLFTDQEQGVEQAAAGVEAALRQADFTAERLDDLAGLADIFPGMGESPAEWIITSPGGQELRLQLAYFDRRPEPVMMDVGAVLDIENVADEKVRAGEPGRAPRLRRYRRDAGPVQPGPADRVRSAAGPLSGCRDFADAAVNSTPDPTGPGQA